MVRLLLNQRVSRDSEFRLTILGCSKGAEVYSFLWAIRSARSDLKVITNAADISREIVDFAANGVYLRDDPDAVNTPGPAGSEDVTWRDQPRSIFERMAGQEMSAMFDLEGEQAKIKPWLKEGITWRKGDAADPELADNLGPQDMVVANRFLCHMEPPAAETCLRNIGRMVKPGGYLFVSGVDLDVRARVAKTMGWKPVTMMLREIYEGDSSLFPGWPLEWWGLEPYSESRPDWEVRYASVFQIGAAL